MSNSPDDAVVTAPGGRRTLETRLGVAKVAISNGWFSQTINRHNLVLLGMISAFLTGIDTIQSFYLQRVVNQFNEANLLPLKFYNNGIVGYILYAPIDFLALYGTLTVLWLWASYLLWYFKHFLSRRV
jgi:hypothetical protein